MLWSDVVKKGWLDQSQLDKALEISSKENQPMLKVIQEKNWLTPAQIQFIQEQSESSQTVNISSDLLKDGASEIESQVISQLCQDLNLEDKTNLISQAPFTKTIKASVNSLDEKSKELNRDTTSTKIQSNTDSHLTTHVIDYEAEEKISEHDTNPTAEAQEIKIDRIGDYQIQEEIGRGGMGVVFRAFHERLNQNYAIKILLSTGIATQDSVNRFHQEAKTNAKLKHKFIVQVFNSGVEQEYHYIVMELIKGSTLSLKLLENPPSVRESLILIRNTLIALQFAHEQGVIHRDIKLENIFEIGNNEIKLADFGLARDIQLDSRAQRLTHSGTIIGTPAYMAPEQVLGRIEAIDARSDLYSVGICLFELLTKTYPFSASSMHEILTKILKEEPVPPSKLAPNIHKDIDTIVLRAIEKDKKRRYQSAKEFLMDINLFLKGYPIRSRPNTKIEIIGKWVKRHRFLSFIIAFLLFIFLGIGADRVRGRTFNNKLLNQHIDLLMFQIRAELRHYLNPAEIAVNQIKYLVQNKLIQPKNLPEFMLLLQGVLQETPNFTNVGFGDSQGNFIMAARQGDGIRFKNVIPGQKRFLSFWRNSPKDHPTLIDEKTENFDCRTRPWFKLAKESPGIFWTNPYMMFSSQQPGITCATRMMDKNGQLQGVLFVDINTKDVSNFVGEFDSILEGLITNRKGEIFAYSKHWPVRRKEQKLVLPNIAYLNNEVLPREKIVEFLEKLDPNKDTTESQITSFHKKKRRYLLGMFPFQAKNQYWCFWYVIGESNFLDPPPIDDVTLGVSLLMLIGMLLIFITRLYRGQKLGFHVVEDYAQFPE